MSDEYEGFDDEDEDIKWRTLDPKERAKFLKLIFEDEDWYDGVPFFQGGDTNPDFSTVCDRSGAPMGEVKRYYKSWLERQGFDYKRAEELDKGRSGLQAQPSTQQVFNNTQGTASPQVQMPQANVAMGEDPMDKMMMQQMQGNQQSSEASNMMFMMHFLTSQQRMQMQQQQFQAQLMMQQRASDQQREADMRREQMARDQQFMAQQTTLLRESFKRANDGGFQGKIQEALQEKMIDELVNGKETSMTDSVKEVLASDTLKEAVGGLGAALMARQGGVAPQPQIPMGYDSPDYNPYAQPTPNQYQPAQPQVNVPPVNPEQPPMDGVFFEGEAEPVSPQPVEQQVSTDEYNQILMQSFSELLGPAMQDPKVAKAVQEQIEVAVDVTLIQMPDALPQMKLQAMSEKMLLVRNLRDICFGLRDLRSRTPVGQAPGSIVLAAVISELRKRPEFYNIFASNSYEELIAQLDPFKDTGAVKFDFEYLLRPEIAEIANHLLSAVAMDSQSNNRA